jgi:hypothetical protein
MMIHLTGPSEDDSTIFKGMANPPTIKERELIAKVINTWADAMPKEATVRISFFACLQILITMGPAYSEIAAKQLHDYYRKAK